MNCEEAESLLGQLVFDDLEEDRKEPLRRHVEKCQKCRELAGDMKVAAKLLKDGIELETPVLSDGAKAGLFNKARKQHARARSGISAAIKFAVVAAGVVLVIGFVSASLVSFRSMRPQLMQSIGGYEDAATSNSPYSRRPPAPEATAPAPAEDFPEEGYEYRRVRDAESELSDSINGAEVATASRIRMALQDRKAAPAPTRPKARAKAAQNRQELQPSVGIAHEDVASGTHINQSAVDYDFARRQEDAISDIPLGGMGVVGNIGIGGGTSGRTDMQPGGEDSGRLAPRSEEKRETRPAGYDGALTLTASPSSAAAPIVVPSATPQAAAVFDKVAETVRRGIVAPDVARERDRIEKALAPPTSGPGASRQDYWMWVPGMDDEREKKKGEGPVDEPLPSQLHALRSTGGGAKANRRLDEIAKESAGDAPTPSPRPSRGRERGIALGGRAAASVEAPDEIGMEWTRVAHGKRLEDQLARTREEMDHADRTMQMADAYRRRGDAANAKRLYGLAAEKYGAALETCSWAPYQVDLAKDRQQAETQLKRASALSGRTVTAPAVRGAQSFDWRTILERADKAEVLPTQNARAATGAAQVLDRKVSFSFSGETVHDALRHLASLTKLKIDIDPDLVERAASSTVTLVARDTKLGLGLEWLLRLGDLDYSVQKDGLFVSTPERIARDRLIALNVDDDLPVHSARWLAAQEMLGVEPPERVGLPSAAAPARDVEAFVQLSQDEAARLDRNVLLAQEAVRARAERTEQEEPPPLDVEDEAPLPEIDEDRPPPPVNPFVLTARDRFSTFAMDVDTASYSLARNYITRGSLPARNTVRMEEYVNAFDYNYPRQARDTFNIFLEGTPAPFGQGLQLLKVGIQARVVGRKGRKSAHLTFVVDSSGSMETDDRLPLVQHALKMLLGELSPSDHVSLVAYGTEPQILLEFVAASDRERIEGALDSIRCAGSTNLSTGLTVGYDIAKRQFNAGAINRVILCSDGVANVGLSEAEEILDTVKQYRDWGISITSAGFGSGSYSDEMLEKLANSGDGNYVFIDSPQEARRVFVEQMSATIQNVAKDAKIQVEFDPSAVRRYRLIGYENRDIADKDFRNDSIDAGEVGSGQSVTALYEIEFEPDALRNADVGTVFVRYRNTDTNEIEEISRRIARDAVAPHTPESNPRLFLAASAAEFAELLRGSEHAAGGSFAAVVSVLERATGALPLDQKAKELLSLVKYAKRLKGEK